MLKTIKSQGKYTIKQIFKDNWNNFYIKNKGNIRDAVIENVEKVMACGDKNKMGYSAYTCPCCGQKRYAAHACKSRFCNSCGKVMTDNRIKRARKELLNAPYYHIAFSPPSELWRLFRR